MSTPRLTLIRAIPLSLPDTTPRPGLAERITAHVRRWWAEHDRTLPELERQRVSEGLVWTDEHETPDRRPAA